MLVAILIGLASAAVCFMALLWIGLSVPLTISCSAAVGCAIFLLALSIVKLVSYPKRGREEFFDEEENDNFEPPKVVTLKSKSPEELEREKREQLIKELEEKNREAQRRIAALKKRER